MNNSENYYRLLKEFTPGGSQTLSKMPERYINGVYPKVLERGKNGIVRDVDGNDYIDFISGLGAISCGYSVDEINNAIEMQLAKGSIFSLPNTLEYLVARRLTELIPSTEMWKFGKNGTDGTVMAVRAARAFTGRTKIMTVGYNGCADQFEIKGVRTAGIPKVLDETITKALYNNLDTFEDLYSRQYACVLLEPMVTEFPKDNFLEDLRYLCSTTGTVLIFDEVVTGGRFEGFVAQHYFRVVPDLTVLSKGLGNGLPISAVGGKRSVMETFGRDDFFASGTFGGECLSLAAMLATVKILENEIPQMVWNGSRIKEAFNKLYGDVNARCEGYPTRLNFVFENPVHKALFWQEMCVSGVLIGYNNFVMARHTDLDISKTIDAMFSAHKFIKENWSNPEAALKGKMPVAALRK